MARADVIATGTAAIEVWSGAGVNYVIQANNGHRYIIYCNVNQDAFWTKSTDGGFTWSNPVSIFTGTVQALSVWYDRWSGRSTDKIRIAYTEQGGNDILYRDIDTASSDALGTQTTIFNGVSVAAGGSLTIWTSRHGEIRATGSIDAAAEKGAWSSTDDGATWGDTIADPTEATTDQYFGLPGWNADTADEMVIMVDASANGLSVKRYDDSANTWTETAIIADASFVDQVSSTAFPHVACAVDIANSRNIVACWNAVDAANQDLRVFIIDDTTITETAANAVLNATDDCGLVAFGIATDTGVWYVFYGGKSDGSETYPSAITINYKTSSDSGATWSAETALSLTARDTEWIATMPRFTGNFGAAIYNNTTSDNILFSVLLPTAQQVIMNNQAMQRTQL